MGRHPDTVQYFFVACEIPFCHQECVGRIACCVPTAGIRGEGQQETEVITATAMTLTRHVLAGKFDLALPA